MNVQERAMQLIEENGKDMKVILIKQLRDEFGISLSEGKVILDNAIKEYEIINPPVKITVAPKHHFSQEDTPYSNSAVIQADSYPSVLKENFRITYKGGHPSLTKEKECNLVVYSDLIRISYGFSTATIPMSQISSCQFETQDQIESRYTATRILALGVFALAFKKKKKTSEKFLTIEFTDTNGITNVVMMSGNSAQRAHSQIYATLTEFINARKLSVTSSNDIQPMIEPVIQSSNNTSDPYEEIKKLKELLDMGIVTQDEFNQKKKELLNL